MTRKLASIAEITYIKPIEGADAIECAIVNGGWPVVVKKGEYQVSDLAIYLEIDSWVPHELAPFLSKGQEPREYNGVKGERLKTVKLRGQVSQGLLLPLSTWGPKNRPWTIGEEGFDVGTDLTEYLGIQKWEPPIPSQLQGTMRGNFPHFIPKTDQERCQNLRKEFDKYQSFSYEVTEKLEGTSMTCFIYDEEFNVCSRNLNLKETEGNTYWNVARKYKIEEKLREFGYGNIAIQSEILGPAIQNNIYGLQEHQFFVFDVYDIKNSEYFTPEKRQEFCKKLELQHAPVLETIELKNLSIENIISIADGFSQLNNKVLREGIVFKSLCGTYHFKSISNQYLLKTKL
jgi:RNA ligase (TIGR02306 family)